MSVRCWYYDVRELADPALFARGMELLPWAERRERIGRFRLEADRRLSLGAGLICAHALKAAGAGSLRLGYGAYGKPYLTAAPEICFNLSHSGNMAVCAVSDRELGVDVEKLREPDRRVAKRCFQACELAWMDAQPDAGRAFTRLWTRKESYLKMLGTGLSKAADSFSALPDEQPEPGAGFSELSLPGHLVCACCRGEEPVEWVPWRLGKH